MGLRAFVVCDGFGGSFVFAVGGSMIFEGCWDESFTVCVDIGACDGVLSGVERSVKYVALFGQVT